MSCYIFTAVYIYIFFFYDAVKYLIDCLHFLLGCVPHLQLVFLSERNESTKRKPHTSTSSYNTSMVSDMKAVTKAVT